MQFYNYEYLNFLWLLIGIGLLVGYHQKKRKTALSQLIDLRHLGTLAPRHNSKAFLRRSFYFAIAFIFFVFALARPQWGQEQKTVQRKGLDVVFVLDTSLSMLTEDVKP